MSSSSASSPLRALPWLASEAISRTTSRSPKKAAVSSVITPRVAATGRTMMPERIETSSMAE